MVRFSVFSETDIGRVRSVNQDRAFSWVQHSSAGLPLAVLLVADGMGGHEVGEVASGIAIETVSDALVSALAGHDRASGVVEDLERLFRKAIAKANDEVYRYARVNLGAKSMGTTIAGVVIVGEVGVAANVGDTRVYLMDDWGLEQVTVDHTVAGELAEEGYIDAEDVIDHPERHILNQALGLGLRIEAGVERIEVEAGARILVCSDGLWGAVRDLRAVERALERARTPEDAVWALIELANRNGGEDNIGVAVCTIGEE